MELIVGKTAGFCLGVSNAVTKAEEVLKDNTKVYCLGELIHNKQVIKELELKGMITVNNIEEVPNNSKVIFRAHGEAKKIYDIAKEKKLEIVDLTCGKVRAIHIKVEREKDDAFIIIIGKATHPEIIGTKGFAGKNSYIIENEDDILDAYMEYEKTGIGNVFVVAQTTFSSHKFDKLVKEIETNFYEANVKIDKTICDATELRQSEVIKISKEVNTMIIIGGRNSSNTKEIAEIAKRNCENVYLVETVEDLKDVKFSENEKIGIMAGASTPQKSIEDVINSLKQNYTI